LRVYFADVQAIMYSNNGIDNSIDGCKMCLSKNYINFTLLNKTTAANTAIKQSGSGYGLFIILCYGWFNRCLSFFKSASKPGADNRYQKT